MPLKEGVEFDRWGREQGSWTSPPDVPWWERSLPGKKQGYGRYRVVKEIPGVKEGHAEPAFGQPGLGKQWELPMSVEELLDQGYIERVGPFDPTAVPR
ncbi:MAG: hypothetical protein HMLKMBBP_00714 [Planctomycetes bacterium]|nr:hypothetical protein [Planctomycetota bacterium]